MIKLDEEKRRKIEDYIQSAKNGKTDDFGKVYDLLIDHIYQFIYWKVRRVEEAEDLTEDVFKKAWLGLSSYKAKNFCGYMFTIARNSVIDHYRKHKETTSIEKATIIDETDGPFDRYIKRESGREIIDKLKRLPEFYREVIVLRFIQDLSIEETAAALKKSKISIRVAQFRALKKLKNLFKKI